MLTPEQKKAKAEYKKQKNLKKMQRRSRCRGLKNFALWFTGFITSLALIAGSVFVAIGVLPISTYVKDDNTVIPSEYLSGTILNFMQDFGIFNPDNIVLSSVLPEDDGVMWMILKDGVYTENPKGITVGDIKTNFDINRVSLEIVLPRTEIVDGVEQPINVDIWKTLDEAVTEKPITIGALDTFGIGNITLKTVLTDSTGNIINQKLWNILHEAVPETSRDEDGNIRVDHLRDFIIDGVHLSTALDDSQGNKILEALLSDPDTTFGNLGEKIDDLKVKTVYDIKDFTENAEEALPSSPKYRKDNIEDEFGVHDYYVLDNTNGTYYISKESKMWLLLLYSAGEKDSNGNALTYTCKDLTLGNINQTVSEASTCFMNATIKMLVDSGILVENTPNYYSKIYAKTVQGVFDEAVQ